MNETNKSAADIYVFDVDPESDTAAANVLRLVGRDKDILEIGAGPGSIARPLIEKNGCRVTALEADPKCLPILRKFCVDVIHGDLNRPDWAESLSGRSFDVIVIADVLEHLINLGKPCGSQEICSGQMEALFRQFRMPRMLQ